MPRCGVGLNELLGANRLPYDTDTILVLTLHVLPLLVLLGEYMRAITTAIRISSVCACCIVSCGRCKP